MNPNDPICYPCAIAKGWTPVDRDVGHWVDVCSVCERNRDVNAVRDWKKK